MDSRQQFEEWVRARAEKSPSGFYPQLLHRCALDETRYMISWVDSAFEGWQASRESIEVDLGSMTNNGYEGFYPANHIKRALRDSGIRTK